MPSSSAILETDIRRFSAGLEEETRDQLAVEEPLEIRVGFSRGGNVEHKAISITMRTPGDDGDLAAGFLFTEGILSSPDQIRQIRHCGLKIGKAAGTVDRVAAINSNTIRVDLADGVEIDLERLKRHFYTSSSCGVCGKSSIEALHTGAKRIESELTLRSSFISELPDRLRAAQNVFERTGGLHASALFNSEGEIDLIREDVGRHNALDKVIGAKFMAGETPLSNRVLLVSGRASFELVQKALMSGIPVLAAVGAPSSLAVELAREFGMTLMGFVRDGRFNVYCGGERIV
ncbi:MAG TPA: formate dehydrogenase accessory sulfurtransferase FdhD [Pyrinomonadaceae bacterium]|jgi:FdhD protein|nr:formate dehydrogenase accessory sulfurtransferase FdhD [Pyrinomonadaceae bacterium]